MLKCSHKSADINGGKHRTQQRMEREKEKMDQTPPECGFHF